MMSCRVPLAITVPPRRPPPGPKINNMVGLADGVFIMFYNNNAVAPELQLADNRKHAPGVMRVQSDGGFIQHVECAAQV